MAGHKYAQVRDHLLHRIRDLPVGGQLPAESVLCAEYEVSRITLRRAVDELVQDGYLVREHGRGTFVTHPRYHLKHRERFVNEVTGFHTQLSRQGHTVTSEVVAQERMRAGARLAAALDISRATSVIRLERLRRVNGVVHHLAESFVPEERFPDVLTTDFTSTSLYAYLRAHHDLLLARNEIVVGLHICDEREAGLLGVAEGSPLLLATSCVFEPGGKPVIHGTSKFLPETAELSFDIVADVE
ncbi:GntR family transcriptional regulator [Streptomyces hygroscopicus subsp. hygroscopicus]|uniref:GntR family transcriptional regulator n=1 Tax=Streptomyces hygroscopicus TaxID=1912 RepID=UPI001C65DE4D|nr:GntR family transcriptional regulator [Streptomyces hygroscopicus]MBW8090994.1 GntR family transcriptional regulator [Streptomyces hygroscopicus subsp. hygroscopicus]